MSQPLNQSEPNTQSEQAFLASTTPVCPVSRSLDTRHLCKVDGFDVWRCAESATDFVWPMPDDKTLKAMYDREAWFEGGERGGYQDYDLQTEPSLHAMTELLERFTAGENDLNVLDVGCGYGNHLQLAANKGWKCFGIEPSDHARSIAQQRHGSSMTVVETVEDLFPVRFDLIVMFEVIEHLQDPYALLFTLFGRGAIGPDTLVVISTPNARSNDAVTNPGAWAYRHPPSHLVFYSAKSFEVLMRRLLFKEINIRGIVPLPPHPAAKFEDEEASINDGLGDFMGIVAEARGSNFREFMHERYVPGTYWKLTEYEHFPRYGMAARMAQGARVLDLGCGTGYGTAQLGEVAKSVVGMDIAEEAIKWARQTHRNPKLTFERRSDLGQGFPKGSFDLVTCFEMIEHVDHKMQLDTIRSISNMLTPGGKLVISTPDPRFTAPYGHNPYHLREMTEPEFLELLQVGFKHVTILKQWVRPSIFIGPQSISGEGPVVFDPILKGVEDDLPVGFVAICSNEPMDNTLQFCQFDTSVDFSRQALRTENKLNGLRYENYSLSNSKREYGKAVTELQKQIRSLNESTAWLASQGAVNTEEHQKQVQSMNDNIVWLESERIKDIDEHQKQIQAANGNIVWLTNERSAWEAVAGERLNQITGLQEQCSHLETQRQRWENLAVAREQTIEHLNFKIGEFEVHVSSLEMQRSERDKTIAELVAARNLILESWSWKITQPLRYIRRKLMGQ